MKSALTNCTISVCFGKNSRANVVLPAPFGPAMTMQRGSEAVRPFDVTASTGPVHRPRSIVRASTLPGIRRGGGKRHLMPCAHGLDATCALDDLVLGFDIEERCARSRASGENAGIERRRHKHRNASPLAFWHQPVATHGAKTDHRRRVRARAARKRVTPPIGKHFRPLRRYRLP